MGKFHQNKNSLETSASDMDSKLDKIYRRRFNEKERREKDKIWKVLCGDFFQKYIPAGGTVLDVGAGYCEFINNIQCGKKYAVDLNEDTPGFAQPDVEVTLAPSTRLDFLADESTDIAFMSNFLEHLKTKDDILKTFAEIYRVLKPGGKVMILQPNIRYLVGEYWDFFDHHIPLTDKSLAEGLEIKGFVVEESIARFLPFTTKSRIPKHPLLVRMYLRLPLVWKIMGRQAFVLARKP